ncbi:hypothetical protein R55227_BLOPHJLP_00214 [Fructobacillus tropaeoli]|uniref:DUF3800 domain-containing protein n=1 Tax=Fructobacillus tropaeoli TaxID=709323 RepID=UPI002DAC3DB4|nr:hypothetical protein R55227_BLOPHJLP_00214 [Fructobacillus tropaeoli]
MVSKTVFIDESGNFGKRGRHFVIAAVIFSDNTKKGSIRKVKKVIGKSKVANSDCVSENGELKATDISYPERRILLEKLNDADFKINFVVCDLKHSYSELLAEQNLFYNYLLQFIIKPIVKYDSKITELHLIIDMRNKTIRKGKKFDSYIKTKIIFEWQCRNVAVDVEYLESQNSIGLQCADHVANALYGKYEFGSDNFDVIEDKVCFCTKFPNSKFDID